MKRSLLFVAVLPLSACGVTINQAEPQPTATATVTATPEPDETGEPASEDDVLSPSRTSDRRDFLNHIAANASGLYWQVEDDQLAELGQTVCDAMSSSDDVDTTQAEMLGLMLGGGFNANQSATMFDASVMYLCPEFEGMSSEAANG